MGKMVLYTGEEIEFHGCPGCAYARHEFTLPCGFAYEDECFTLSQDWELPIPGFFVLSPKRCVETWSDLTKQEKEQMVFLMDKTLAILRKLKICEHFDVVFEEKPKRHFHLWIMPREEWMMHLSGSIIGHIEDIFSYAKNNMRNDSNFEKIKKITNSVRSYF